MTNLHGLNSYQYAELKKLTDQGWTVERVRRIQDDLNPWASIYMRSPNGKVMLTALPVSKDAL